MFDFARRRPMQLFAADGAAAAKPRPVRSWPTQRGGGLAGDEGDAREVGRRLAAGEELAAILRDVELDEAAMWQRLRERAAEAVPPPQALLPAGGRDLARASDDPAVDAAELWVTGEPATAAAPPREAAEVDDGGEPEGG